MSKYKKPTIQQSIAPNATLIQGEAMLRASQNNNPMGVMQNVANSMAKYMVPAFRAAERKKQFADEKWNSWLSQLGPDVDTEGLNAQQTSIIGQASQNLKNQFLEQYQIVNSIKNTQSPEYMEAVGKMNGIINDFKGLASFKNGHLTNKENFTTNKKQGNYSTASQNDGSYNTGIEIYGAGIDGNGSQWALAEDGKTILYSTSNGLIKPADVPEMTLVDFENATKINTMLAKIDEAGIGLTGSKERQLRGQLEIMFTDPKALNSAIYDGKIQGINIDIPEEILNGDPDVLRETVINQIVEGSRINAAEEKTRRKNSFRSSRGGGGGGNNDGYYAPEYTGQLDEKGNKIYARIPKDPNGEVIYITLGQTGSNNTSNSSDPILDNAGTPSSYDRDGDGVPDSFDIDGGDGTGTPGAFGPRNNPNSASNNNNSSSGSGSSWKKNRELLEQIANDRGIKNPTDKQLEEIWESVGN